MVPPALGQATVVVPGGAGYSWAIRDLSLFPRKKADAGVSVTQVNAWLNAHRGMKSAYSVCLMDFVQNDEIASLDDATQAEIAQDLKEYPSSFAQVWTVEPDITFTVRVAAFRECSSQTPNSASPMSFLALVITDSQNQIRFVDATEWSFIRIFRRDDGKLNILGCFACGEVRELAWDRGGDRFYFVDIGH